MGDFAGDHCSVEKLTQEFCSDPLFAQIQEIMTEGVQLSAKCVEQISKASEKIGEYIPEETVGLYSEVQELAVELEARSRFRNLSISEIVKCVK